MRRFFICSLTALLIIYYLILPFVLPSLIYIPTKEEIKPFLNFRDIYIKTSDNVKIDVWYAKAMNNKQTILFCHGNSGNISKYQELASFFSKKGYGILLFDYRGYGKSEGSPSETGLYNDVNAALKFLKEKEKLSNNQIILWGVSLGGAVAAEEASKERFRAVILQSTFTNIKDEAIFIYRKDKNKFIKALIKTFFANLIYYQKYETISKIGKISSPLLILHSKEDETVPVEMSYRLSKLNPKAKLYITQKNHHNDIYWAYDKILNFISKN